MRLADRARTELAAAGGRPRRVAMRGRDALTPSELRIARLAADGLSNPEIAQMLFITRRTVETHLTQTYRKLVVGDALGRADREQLTTWMLANQSTVTRFGAGVPEGWRLADKTGGGEYATRNDIGVTWTPSGAPIVIAALTRSDDPDAEPIDAALVDIAATVCTELR